MGTVDSRSGTCSSSKRPIGNKIIPWLARVWRLLALSLAALLLHVAARSTGAGSFSPVISDARAFFPEASELVPRADQSWEARAANGASLGMLVTTSPDADGIHGYSGRSNLLVALDADQRIAGIRILESEDTPAHVEALRTRQAFVDSLKGWNPAAEPPPIIAGVGGSTLTGLAMVEGVAQRLGGKHTSLRFAQPLTVEEVREFFPTACEFHPNEPFVGWNRITDSAGVLQGFVVRTSPAADAINGYAGPTESLVAIAADQQSILRIKIRKSYDTEEYVERVVEDGEYLKSLTRWKVAQWPSLNFEHEKIEGVAGATMTSAAIAEGLKARFSEAPQASHAQFWSGASPKNIGLLAFLLGSVAMSFSSLRGKRGVRLLWQLLLIAGLGLWLGQFVTLGLLVGWARNGLQLAQAAPLFAVAAVALLVPLIARRQLYCHQICPHGAAQELLGRLSRRSLQPSVRVEKYLRLLPGILLASAFFTALVGPVRLIANFEAFDFWVLGRAAVVPAILAVIGLAASLFTPMAYCRYGCPTGALFGFLRSQSSYEGFKKRDLIAALVLGVGALAVMSSNAQKAVGMKSQAPTEVRGTGFGTTWCVKIRGTVSGVSELRKEFANEVERIESTLSHWRPNSATSRFNETFTTDVQQIPEELGRLVAFAQRVNRASDGAYDITVAPLVSAWGYGPSGETSEVPSEEMVHSFLERVGFDKLELGADYKTLRKTHPATSLDLGSILQGYAADRLAEILRRHGYADHLVEVGGELRASGSWNVAIENPADASQPLLKFPLKDASLATSGLARARRRLAGQTVSHIISPKTGYPVNPTIELCSIQAQTCLEADGWATAVIASGSVSASALIEREGLKAWILEAGGRALQSIGE